MAVLNTGYLCKRNDRISEIRADEISEANYSSKTHKYSSEYVRSKLIHHNLIPVTTGFPTVSGNEDRS